MYVHLRNILHVHVSTLYLPYINTLPVYMYRYVLYMYIYSFDTLLENMYRHAL